MEPARRRSLRPALLLVALAAVVVAVVAAPAQARVAYGVGGGNTLISFNTNAPSAIAGNVPITGLQPAEQVLGIDVQPSNGQLFALGSTSRLYTLNTQTGVATEVGAGPFAPALSGTNFGFDFNPVTGRIRVVSDADQNIELIPTTGQAISHADIDPGVGPTGAAYTNNFAGATTTALFDVAEATDGQLYAQSLAPDDGSVTAVGGGFGVTGATEEMDFDVGADNTAFATIGVLGVPQLYVVNLTTGTVAGAGAVGAGPLVLTGFAVARPLETTPFAVAFGQETVGQTTAAAPVTVTNTSDAAIAIAASLSGSAAGQFAIASNGCGGSIASGATCSIGVVYRPTQPGATGAAELTLGGVGQGNNAVVPLSGVGIGAAVAFNPASLAFGTQQVGPASAARAVTVTNTGSGPLTVASVAIGGNDPRQFAVASQTCTQAAVAPGASCQLNVVFDPTTTGAKSAHVQLTDNARNGSARVNLTGTATASRASLSTTKLAFGNQATGSTSGPRTVTVTNRGNAPLTVSSLAFSGRATQSFAVSSQTCTGRAIAPGATCAVAVVFDPAAAGAQSATLRINTNQPGGEPTVSLSGTGVARRAGVAVGPRLRRFGAVAIGARSRPRVITVRSTGSAGLRVSRVRLIGRQPRQFRILSQSCTKATLAQGRTCRIRVVFRPTSSGPKRATLVIADNAPPAARIALRGRGRS